MLLEQAAQMRAAGKAAGQRQLRQGAVAIGRTEQFALEQGHALGPDMLADGQPLIGKGVIQMPLAAVERCGHGIHAQGRIAQMLAHIGLDAAQQQLAGAQRGRTAAGIESVELSAELASGSISHGADCQ